MLNFIFNSLIDIQLIHYKFQWIDILDFCSYKTFKVSLFEFNKETWSYIIVANSLSDEVTIFTGEKLVEAHGSFATAHCISCHKEADEAFVKSNNIPQSSPYWTTSRMHICRWDTQVWLWRIDKARHCLLWRESSGKILWAHARGEKLLITQMLIFSLGFSKVWSVDSDRNITSGATVCFTGEQSALYYSQTFDQQRRGWQDEPATLHVGHQRYVLLFTSHMFLDHHYMVSSFFYEILFCTLALLFFIWEIVSCCLMLLQFLNCKMNIVLLNSIRV
jgi:hypothetical protein